ncbi:KIF-binding protein-like [Euwallacea fornicatus]|uniref:KIF-binding protein-like n=1 Tax=Euwallacea fornicatus TaxID=995702 RepID=UPI00338F2EF4
MAGTPEPSSTDELQAYYIELKKDSMCYKLDHNRSEQIAGGEIPNPLHKQFGLMLAKLDETLVKESKDSEKYLIILSMKASIIYEKAKILLIHDFLDESKDLLYEALNLIRDHSDHPKVAFLHMRIVNHLSHILLRLGHLEQAEQLLLRVIEKGEKCNPEVFSTDDLFMNTKESPKTCSSKLSSLVISNMQMLSWIYIRIGKDTNANLKLQHDILQKEMDTAERDVLRWAESCFQLGSMFVRGGDWPNAAYHLTAAESILSPLEAALVPNPEVYALQADLARTWIFYGLQLFRISRKNNIQSGTEADTFKNLNKCDGDDAAELSATPLSYETPMIFSFQSLNIESHEYVPTSVITSVEEAKCLFAYTQKWIKRARLFYTLRDYPLQYVNLSLDESELYRFMAFYEEDLDSQYAVQKRRYDALEMLSSILKELRPNCYVAVNMELMKELVEVQMELMNLNLKKLYSPPQGLGWNANEDILKRKIGAFASIYKQLENVTLFLNINDGDVLTKGAEIPEIHDEAEFGARNQEVSPDISWFLPTDGC